VRKSGNLARYIAIPTGLVFTFSALVGVRERQLEQAPLALWEWAVVGAFVVGGLFVVARSPFVGVWVTPQSLVARSWFRRYTFDRQEVHSIGLVPYAGFLSKGANDWFLKMLEIRSSDGSEQAIPSTIATRRICVLEIAQLEALLGTRMSAAHRDGGPTHWA
jgi:hypothetical protein